MSTPSFDEADGHWRPAASGEGQAPHYQQAPYQQAQYPPAPSYPPAYPPPGYPAPDQQAPGWLAPPPPAAPESRQLRREIGFAAATAAVIALLGFGLGWLWSAIAPWVPAMRTADGAILAQPEQEQMIADEGWYLIITVLAGIAVAILAWVLLRRYRGLVVLIGMLAGCVAAGLVAYWLGHHIGLSHARYLADHAPAGTLFSIPPNLRVQQVGLWQGWLPYAKGDVLAMAIAAVATYLLFAGFSPHPTLRPAPATEADQAGQPAAPVNSGW